MNDDNDGVVKCQKNSTTPPRCHSDQVDPLVYVYVPIKYLVIDWISESTPLGSNILISHETSYLARFS